MDMRNKLKPAPPPGWFRPTLIGGILLTMGVLVAVAASG